MFLLRFHWKITRNKMADLINSHDIRGISVESMGY